jgi:hypothetical protein
VNQVARRLGKTFALVLPVVLVLSGTLAVTRVPWAASSSDPQVLTASAKKEAATPQEALRQKLLAELQEKDPGVALTDLQVAMAKQPSLARYCADIARSLGRAAVAKYDGAAQKAQTWSRPVCDTAFATGVASVG